MEMMPQTKVVEQMVEMNVYRFEARVLVKGTGKTKKDAIEDAVASVADPKIKIDIMNYYPSKA